MDTGAEAIRDPAELSRVKDQARRVWLKSIAAGLVAAGIAAAIPSG